MQNPMTFGKRQIIDPETGLPMIEPEAPGVPPMPQLAPPVSQAPAPNQKDGAPGSSLYQSNVSGIDPNAPIRGMRNAQSEMSAAGADMTTAMNTPTSLKRGILGTLAGAGVGALLGGQAGAQVGSKIINAPRDRAMGLAASRAAGAKAKFDQEKDIAGATQEGQKVAISAEGERRAGATLAETQGQNDIANARAEREVGAPVETTSGMVAPPKLAPTPGGTVNVGGVPKKPSPLDKPEYKVDKSGNLIAMFADEAGRIDAHIVTGQDGQALKFNPDDADGLVRFITNWRKDNPNGSSTEENAEILKYNQSRAQTLALDATRAARDTVEKENVEKIVAGIRNRPEVKAAATSADPNAYRAAIEQLLAEVTRRSPSYAQFVPSARTELLKSQPIKPTQGAADPLAAIRARRQQPQQSPAQ